MRHIGIIGGMSAESTSSYYSGLHRRFRQEHGGLASLPLAIWSVNFAELAAHQHVDNWSACAEVMLDAGRRLEHCGVDAVAISSNLMHKVADELSDALNVPLLHIGDAIGQALQARGISQITLLGARQTMEERFYSERLIERFGIHVRIPGPGQRKFVQDLIYRELCQGKLSEESRVRYFSLLSECLQNSENVLLGCTELGLGLPGFPLAAQCLDSTELHIDYCYRWATSAPAPSE